MRIVQIARLWERVQLDADGGIELVGGLPTDALVHRGHKFTLFATGDSPILTKPELIDRATCREHMVCNFNVKSMLNGCKAVYERILAERMAPLHTIRRFAGFVSQGNQ